MVPLAAPGHEVGARPSRAPCEAHTRPCLSAHQHMRGKKGRACCLRRPVHAPTPSPPSLTQLADPLLPPSPPKKPRRRRRQQRHARCSTDILTFARALPLTAGHQSCGRAHLAPAAACSRRAARGLDKVPLRLSRGEWTWRRSTTRAASRAPPRRCATSSRRCATCRTAAEGAYARSLGRGKGAHRPPRAAQMCGERKRSQWAACTVQRGGWSCGCVCGSRGEGRPNAPPRHHAKCTDAPPKRLPRMRAAPCSVLCRAGATRGVRGGYWRSGVRGSRRGARGARREVCHGRRTHAQRGQRSGCCSRTREPTAPHGELDARAGARSATDRARVRGPRRMHHSQKARRPLPSARASAEKCGCLCCALQRPALERPLSSDAGSTSAFVRQGEAARPRVQARSRVLAALNAARSP